MEYNGKTDTVVLEKNVKARNNAGEKFDCRKAVIVLKDGANSLKLDQVQNGQVNYDDVKEDDEKTAPPPATTGRTGGSDVVNER